MDQEIENYNKGLLQTAFERVSLVPQTAGCFLRLRENTRPMYTLPQIIGQIYMQVCTDPHKFLSASALGLIGPPGTNAQTWWVAMDGWYYVLMSQVIGDGLSATADSIRWYKCGLNAASHDPTNLNEAVPDEGRFFFNAKAHVRKDTCRHMLIFLRCFQIYLAIDLGLPKVAAPLPSPITSMMG